VDAFEGVFTIGSLRRNTQAGSKFATSNSGVEAAPYSTGSLPSGVTGCTSIVSVYKATTLSLSAVTVRLTALCSPGLTVMFEDDKVNSTPRG